MRSRSWWWRPGAGATGAPAAALGEAQPLLMVAAERRDHDAGHLIGLAVREIDVDQDAGRHLGIEELAHDVRREAGRGLPIWRLVRARIVRLRQRDRRNAEDRALDG